MSGKSLPGRSVLTERPGFASVIPQKRPTTRTISSTHRHVKLFFLHRHIGYRILNFLKVDANYIRCAAASQATSFVKHMYRSLRFTITYFTKEGSADQVYSKNSYKTARCSSMRKFRNKRITTKWFPHTCPTSAGHPGWA